MKVESTNITTEKVKADPDWRKARIAARILLRARTGRLCARDRRLAPVLSADPGLTDRLIEQALASLRAQQSKHVST